MLAFLFIAILCFITGFLVYAKPRETIEMQRKFYEKINWKIEPISMDKEIRNTQYMGLLVIVFVIGSLMYYGMIPK